MLVTKQSLPYYGRQWGSGTVWLTTFFKYLVYVKPKETKFHKESHIDIAEDRMQDILRISWNEITLLRN